MATRIADTLGVMGEGEYPLVYAKDVELADGVDLQTYVDTLDPTASAFKVKYENSTYGEEDNVGDWLNKVLDKIYYVKIAVQSFVTIPNASTYEIGTVIPSVQLEWSLNKLPKSQSLSGFTISLDDRNAVYNTPISTNKTFTYTASDGENSVTSSKTFSFAPSVYWGDSTMREEYTSEWALALANSSLKTAISGTYNYSIEDGKYGFLVMPSSFSFSGTAKIGGFDTELVKVGEINLTNIKGFTQKYKIYRTGQSGLGSISMVI